MQSAEGNESGINHSWEYDTMLEKLTEEDFKRELEFLGSEPLVIKTTNAQEIYNYYQMYSPNVMV